MHHHRAIVLEVPGHGNAIAMMGPRAENKVNDPSTTFNIMALAAQCVLANTCTALHTKGQASRAANTHRL